MANKYTEAVWDIIADDEELLATLEAIMSKDYKPFIPRDKAVKVNTLQLQCYLLNEMKKWYDWLPDSAVHLIGGELAMEAFEEVDFRYIAEKVLAGLQGPPGQDAQGKKAIDQNHMMNGHNSHDKEAQ